MADDLKALFKKYDTKGDGRLDAEELSVLMQALDSSFTSDQARSLFEAMDEDLSAHVEIDEFVDYVMGDKGLSKLFRLEDLASEEEAKETLMGFSLEQRHEGLQAAKAAGSTWGQLTWYERLQFCKDRSKSCAEDTEHRKTCSPSRDATSSYQSSAQWRSKPKAESPTATVRTPKPKAATNEALAAAVKAGAAQAQASSLDTNKFGIAAKTQSELAHYSLASDDIDFAGRAPEVMDEMKGFREHLATAGSPLDVFNIDKFLAKGTAGWVFLVENKATGKKHAMKLIRMTVARTGIKEWYISKMLRQLGSDKVVLTEEEVFVLARAGTNPIVDEALSAAGPVPFYVCMVQPLMPWGSLEDLAKEGELSPEIMFQALEDVSSALATMHENNMHHRDVKPENIMLVMEGDEVTSAKLCDLGSATMGNKPDGCKDDIRRFGVTLFSVVTGEGWTKNRLIHESHDALVARLSADVADSDDPNIRSLPSLLARILDGDMSMAEVAEAMRERGDQY